MLVVRNLKSGEDFAILQDNELKMARELAEQLTQPGELWAVVHHPDTLLALTYQPIMRRRL